MKKIIVVIILIAGAFFYFGLSKKPAASVVVDSLQNNCIANLDDLSNLRNIAIAEKWEVPPSNIQQQYSEKYEGMANIWRNIKPGAEHLIITQPNSVASDITYNGCTVISFNVPFADIEKEVKSKLQPTANGTENEGTQITHYYSKVMGNKNLILIITEYSDDKTLVAIKVGTEA